MAQMKIPGVYVVEKNAFPNSVVEVATAVPAFICHTERTDYAGKSVRNKPVRITSMAEYHSVFGFGPTSTFNIDEKPGDVEGEGDFTQSGKEYVLNQAGGNYLLCRAMLLFYQNGGGPCYIVSVGDYGADVDAGKLKAGIETLLLEQEPTMLLIPETTLLDEPDSIRVQQSMLDHCGKMKNRFAILDIRDGYRARKHSAGDCIVTFRAGLGTKHLDLAAAYYPWLNTSIVRDNDLSFETIANPEVLQSLIRVELGISDKVGDKTPSDDAKKIPVVNAITSTWKDTPADDVEAEKTLLHKSLIALSPLYGQILNAVKDKLNVLPPASAMAGVYIMVDNTRGVWKAPANISLNGVVSPTVNITHDDQEDLNVSTRGKSINVIRAFVGEGTLVWGARTLDGNSLDWRYIPVRRTMIMLEESIRLATKAYVFEPNTANTWITIKGMINNFLNGIWKRGGLAGATAEDAYSVHLGLGETMTPEDILEGIVRVSVLVAPIRPAEYIEISFQQQMQKI